MCVRRCHRCRRWLQAADDNGTLKRGLEAARRHSMSSSLQGVHGHSLLASSQLEKGGRSSRAAGEKEWGGVLRSNWELRFFFVSGPCASEGGGCGERKDEACAPSDTVRGWGCCTQNDRLGTLYQQAKEEEESRGRGGREKGRGERERCQDALPLPRLSLSPSPFSISLHSPSSFHDTTMVSVCVCACWGRSLREIMNGAWKNRKEGLAVLCCLCVSVTLSLPPSLSPLSVWFYVPTILPRPSARIALLQGFAIGPAAFPGWRPGRHSSDTVTPPVTLS